jgi:hypothetical protein
MRFFCVTAVAGFPRQPEEVWAGEGKLSSQKEWGQPGEFEQQRNEGTMNRKKD